MMGPAPTLFVGVGSCAEKVLAEFSRLAHGLAASVPGPFGLVLADSFGEELFTCDWAWLSDFGVPEPALVRERSACIGRDDNKLLGVLSSLARKLRAIEPGADPVSSGRFRLSSYVAVDLSEAGSAASAIRLMRVLRQVDGAVDTTAVGLTARTAVTDSAADGTWFEAWKLLLEQLQEGPFAQRVYLLDGCDADKMWFERPEQLHRLGAEFLLYHGFTCRGILRQNERARTGSNESLLNVCGSFGCRTVQADLSLVAQRLAERLAQEDLADLYQRPMPSGWAQSLDELAQSLVDRIAHISQKTHQATPSSSIRRPDRAGALLPGNTEISEALDRTIKQVCSREPLVSLCQFFSRLGPGLARLLAHQRLWERARTRQMAAEALRRQEDNTYGPTRAWLSRPRMHWADRFTPVPQEVSQVMVSRPAGVKGYLAGCLLLAVSLAAVGAGTLLDERLLAIAGGLLSLGASIPMTLPAGWVRHPRHRLCEGQEIRPSVRAVSYRERSSRPVRALSLAMILLGLAGVIWPLWFAVWTLASALWAVMAGGTAGVGLAFLLGLRDDTPPDQGPDPGRDEFRLGIPSPEEAPGHVNPPLWRFRGVGLFALALAGIVLCLGVPAPVTTQTADPWVAHFVGLILVGAGAGLALLPRAGRAYLIERVPRMPQPLAGGIGRTAKDRELPRGVAAMAAWVNRLSLDPDRCAGRSAATNVSQAQETLLDFLAADWDSQLAQAFRRALEARSGKSLKILALQPVLWTECVTKELLDPRAACGDLTSLFALEAVRAWIESHTLPELLSLVNVDVARLRHLAGRLASPHWPAPRVEPDAGMNVIAVGKSVWDALAPLVAQEGKKGRSEEGQGPSTQNSALGSPQNIASSHVRTFSPSSSGVALVPLEWDSHNDAIVILRVVQGLTQGWRGFPGLPGQLVH
jgi:hypothetical protein